MIGLSLQSERDLFINKAFVGTQYFFEGFRPDGYYSEGIGYYNYGFGNFITMRQMVMEATDGKRDFFDFNLNLPLYSAFAFEFPMYKNLG